MVSQKIQQALPGGRLGLNFQKQVRPVEAGHKGVLLRDAQLPADVTPDPGGGRGCQSKTDGLGIAAADFHQLAVDRSEIMTPGRDTMGFVHRQAFNTAVIQQ